MRGAIGGRWRTAARGRRRDRRAAWLGRRIQAAVAVIVAATTLLVGVPGQASVETESRRTGFRLDGMVGSERIDDLWMGSFSKENSALPWFCIEWGTYITSPTKGEVSEKGSVAHRRAAYLIGRYGNSMKAKVHAAVALAVHDLLDATPNWDERRTTLRRATDQLGAEGTSALADAYLAESKTAYGAWSITTPEITLDADRHGGVVGGLAVRSASGAEQEVEMTLTLSGSATWASTGTATTTLVSGAAHTRRFVLSAGGGNVSVRADVSDTPQDHALVSVPPKDSQLHAASAASTSISASARVPVADWPVGPSATTVAAARLRDGDALTDRVTVGIRPTETWPTVAGRAVPARFRVDWHYSETGLPERSPVPVAAPFATAFVTVTGPGAIDVRADRPVELPGYYYPVASFRLSDQEDQYRGYFTGDWSALLHESEEQTVAPWRPQVRTETSAQRIEVGSAVSDTIVLSGNAPGRALSVESTLWGPFLEQPSVAVNEDPTSLPPPVPAGAPRVGTLTTVVEGNGTATTAELRVDEPGYYVWSERIPSTDETTEWNSDWAPVGEVGFRVHQPRVTTIASSQQANVGATLTDRLRVSGNAEETTLEIVSTLYGPFATAPEPIPAERPWSGVPTLPGEDLPVAGVVKTMVTGDGESTTPGVVVQEPGFYVWVETIAPTAVTAGWAGEFGQASETTLVRAPALASDTARPPVRVELSERLTAPRAPRETALARTSSGAPWRTLPLAVAGLCLGGAALIGAALLRRHRRGR